ncbi:hypothetical protein AQUCO_04300021v1 [Aquilegia coerulea]|uniref:Myb-like domain-containing protein n=1 Tax=Aquilegia coerulea TaxID=218851 RepID=A0A2G5CNF0_AQUCA|nr:hypothetical protein AQUCO_04300021v1 [Aquilegia coerulea]
MALEKVDGVINSAVNSSVNDDGNRAPRLPRWTRQEILVLIQGKKVAENRVRSRRTTTGSNQVEPKWASVSSYCKRHGVNRGPVQCRKRWSNLSGDFKKIKEWESVKSSGESESFWVMRNDLRRERKLPGFFDREVYDILDGGNDEITVTVTEGEDEEEEKVKETDEEFSDFEEQEEKNDSDKVTVVMGRVSPKPTVPGPLPISEKLYQPSCQGYPEQGTTSEMQNASNAEKESLFQEGRKRRRFPSEDGDGHIQSQLIKVLEKNNKMLTTHLEKQNINCELDRDLRKDQANSLVTVLSKLADALGRIADKL